MATTDWKIKENTRVVYISIYKRDTLKIDAVNIDTLKTTKFFFRTRAKLTKR